MYDCAQYQIIKENGICHWGMKGIYHGNDQSLSFYYGPGHTILCELGKEDNFNVLSFLIRCAEVKVKTKFLGCRDPR